MDDLYAISFSIIVHSCVIMHAWTVDVCVFSPLENSFQLKSHTKAGTI